MNRIITASLSILAFCIVIMNLSSKGVINAGREIHPPGTRGGPMVLVPAGLFLMGLSNEQRMVYMKLDKKYRTPGYDVEPAHVYNTEMPIHRVYLDAFYIDTFEVTAEDFRKCVKAGGCKDPVPIIKRSGHRNCTYMNKDKKKHPMNCVTWFYAKDYCSWAGKRLPTEAEWEKAARGTDGRLFPWKENSLTAKKYGNFADLSFKNKLEHFDYPAYLNNYDDGFEETAPVGSFPEGASPYGAMDMLGNVYEWCNDIFDYEYYKKSPRKNPQGPSKADISRARRGGCYWDTLFKLRVTYRATQGDGYKDPSIGFRCALNAK